MNRQTILLVIAVLLLGINVGIMLGERQTSVNFLPTATAGSPVIDDRGTLFTSSADGSILYEWRRKSTGQSTPNPWIATEYRK